MKRSIRLVLIVAFASLFSPQASANDGGVVFEGSGVGGRWVDAVSLASLTSAVPQIDDIGSLQSISAASCSSDGFMTDVEFTGTTGAVEVESATLAAVLGWPSDDLFMATHSDDPRPGCWDDGDVITETRRVRVAEVIVDDTAGGDGDGFAECDETVHIDLVIGSVTDVMSDAQVVIEVRGTEAAVFGPSWAELGNLAPGVERVTLDEFVVEIDSSVSGHDWITVVVWVGNRDRVHESHRHIPLGCGLGGSTEISPRLVFPVAGPNHYAREWLTTHNVAIHEGVDIFASRLVPILAMADGVVADVNWEYDPYRRKPIECCSVAIIHDSGWESWYSHLNNDTPGTDDGAGWGVMPGIERGTRVQAGQVIGFMGDSGNAEGTAPHLHLELHDPAGNPVDPYDYLIASRDVTPICTGDSDDCFPFVILAWNSRDPRVSVVQALLAEAGFTPGIADGIFGSRTDAAVREFQSAAGLEADGLVDEPTWDELNRVVDENVVLQPTTVASRGDRGPVVVEVQTLLGEHGFSPGPVDGIFGTQTELAVTRFRSSRSLGTSGVVDDATFAALSRAATSTSTLLRLGSRGPAVVELQSLLADAGFNPGIIDGIFGGQTERAVRSFQSAARLGVDGIVGAATLNALGGDVTRVIVARRGDTGASVLEIQTRLDALGYAPGPIDGIFGGLTETAVRGFQAARGLPIDGLVDQATLNALG